MGAVGEQMLDKRSPGEDGVGLNSLLPASGTELNTKNWFEP